MRKLLYAATFLTLFHSAGWVGAQTIKERLDKARTEVNLVENTADRAVYACSRNQQPKCTDEARAAKNAASRALYAIDQALKTITADPTPVPVPEPTPEPVPEPTPQPEPIAYSASPLTVVEGMQAVLNTCRTGAGTTTLTYSTSDGTAKAPADYTARDSVRQFTDASKCQNLLVQTIEDTLVEGSETLFMNLTGGVRVQITIQDNDVAAPTPEPEPVPTPTPTPTPTGSVKAIQACSSAPYSVGSTSNATDGSAMPIYGKLTVGQTYPKLSRGVSHKGHYELTVGMPTGQSSTTFAESCFG